MLVHVCCLRQSIFDACGIVVDVCGTFPGMVGLFARAAAENVPTTGRSSLALPSSPTVSFQCAAC